ncbi:MAG TPA: hypothetical protein VM369_08670 [Candidatus Binatia bacterium]|nr:hypothetical protein [Candidatus Binatia bacterium]
MSTSYRFETVWPTASEDVRREAIALWREHHAIPDAEAAERAKQLAVTARDESGRLAAVCTAYKAPVPRLEHELYYLRAFVAPPARRSRVGVDLVNHAKEALTRYNASLPPERRLIGIVMDIEAEVLKKGDPEIVWAHWSWVDFYFIGRTPRGTHLRVHYFKEVPLRFAAERPAQ